MMDDNMFACHTIAMQRWKMYKIWWVTAIFSIFRNFIIKIKNTYQYIHLKYPISDMPDEWWLPHLFVKWKIYFESMWIFRQRFTVVLHILQS